MRKSEALRIRKNLETSVQSLDDASALEMLTFYPTWEDLCDKAVTVKDAEFKFVYGGELYKTVSAGYTFVSHYVPGVGTESLFERIDETHAGTAQDPIPYDGNMALTAGVYYVQGGVVYRCIRDTGNPVYHTLAELVGIYVDEVS